MERNNEVLKVIIAHPPACYKYNEMDQISLGWPNVVRETLSRQLRNIARNTCLAKPFKCCIVYTFAHRNS